MRCLRAARNRYVATRAARLSWHPADRLPPSMECEARTGHRPSRFLLRAKQAQPVGFTILAFSPLLAISLVEPTLRWSTPDHQRLLCLVALASVAMTLLWFRHWALEPPRIVRLCDGAVEVWVTQEGRVVNVPCAVPPRVAFHRLLGFESWFLELPLEAGLGRLAVIGGRPS